jgi:hypothetical protein
MTTILLPASAPGATLVLMAFHFRGEKGSVKFSLGMRRAHLSF